MSDLLSDADLARLKPLQDRLANLMNRKARIGHWEPNKRYVLEFGLPADEVPVGGYGDADNTYASFEQQTLIERGKVFLCEEIEVVFAASGTSAATEKAATIVIGGPWRNQFVDFYLKFRDTGSDRDWQNDWVAGGFFQSANLSGFMLDDEDHILVSGGSEVFAAVQIARNNDSAVISSGLSTITQYLLTVSLIGCQITLEGA